MYNTIHTFPRQFLVGYQLGVSPPHPNPLPPPNYRRTGKRRGKIKGNIFLAGMGGSALPGDLLNDYLQNHGCYSDPPQAERIQPQSPKGSPLGRGPFRVDSSGSLSCQQAGFTDVQDDCLLNIIRDYKLPRSIQSSDLILCSSYSGNTEETLSAFDDALVKKANIIVLTHGGKLKEKALKHKVPLVSIPDCIQPRCAAGYFFSAILGILEQFKIIPLQKESLTKLAKFLEQRRDSHEKGGKKLAKALVDRIPIIYGPTELAGTCRVWKIKFNENSKIQSFYNVFPEVNHNEMVGYTRLLMPVSFIFLRSKFMHARIGRRMDVMSSILKEKIPVHNINLEGENLLQEMFDGLAVADYASYYLAEEYGVDPAAVRMVEDFKKKL